MLEGELLHKFKVYTGLREDKIKEHLINISCDYNECLIFYASKARFPSIEECKLINDFGANAVIDAGGMSFV